MNREEADKALGIIRKVIQNTREDLVAHNWGLIWLVQSVITLSACLGGWYVQAQGLGVLWYLAPLAAGAALNLVVVLMLAKRSHGVRSYVEWQIHGISVTFFLATITGMVVLARSPEGPQLFGSLFALLCAAGFAMIWVVFGRQLPAALAMLGVALISPLVPAWQWILIGLVWWGAMFFPGLSMHRENRRRLQEAHATQLL